MGGENPQVQAGSGAIPGLARSPLAQGQGAHSAHPPVPLNLPALKEDSPGASQRWQLQAGVVAGCPASLLPCTTLLPGPGTSLMPFGPPAGLQVASPAGDAASQSASIPASHLNCRALGRGPCCSPTATMGPESCGQLCHHSKRMFSRGRGEAPVLPAPWKSSSPLAPVLSAQHPSKPPPPLKAVFATRGTGRGMCTESPLGTTPRCSFLLAK